MPAQEIRPREPRASCRVLVVDTDREMHHLARNALSLAPDIAFEMEEAFSLEEARETCASFRPALAILRLGVDGQEGTETLRAFRSLAPNVPVLVVGSNEDDEFGRRVVSGGAQDYLVKSRMHPKALLRCIRYTMARTGALPEEEGEGDSAGSAGSGVAPSSGSRKGKSVEIDTRGARQEEEGEPLERKYIVGARILAADDVTPMRTLIKTTLGKAGALVEEAASGEETVWMVRREAGRGNGYRLLLLDLMMPDMTGMEVLKKLRGDAVTRDLPVIILSGAKERAAVVECIRLGIERYLIKPVRPTQLLEAVEETLRPA
jgi:DNA-binding response OmpR family regulator